MSLDLAIGGTLRSARRWTVNSHPILLTLLACVPLAIASSWHSVGTVWSTGAFFNTDDATRAVEVRDWMAGQAWFDLTVHRMGLPNGLLSHWSRVVDVPLAALIRVFALALPPDLAERAARIAYPLFLQVGLIAAMAYAARVLAGPRASMAAGLLIVLGGIGSFQFEPGRIHHHSPQILLLTLLTATTLDSLDPARAGRAAATGVLLALSLAIGLENLPFLAVVLAVPPVAWILGGVPMRAALLRFAASLAIATPAVFAATVPPGRYALSTVDAFSLVHLVAILLGAGGCALLAWATPRLATRRARALAALAAAIVLGAILAAGFPEALHGPFYGMDPLLRRFWLDEVEEVRPLLRLLIQCPDVVVALMVPMLLGIAAAGVALARSRGLARTRWAVLMVLLVVGFAGSVWAIRVASSLQPLALLGAAWAVAAIRDAAVRDGRPLAIVRPYAALLACSSLVWAILPLPGAAADAEAPSCLTPSALQPLAGLEPGLAFAPIDAGPFLLAHTGLSVLAAPYHRDNAGNHAVIAGFLAPPDEARTIVRATGARYLMTCEDEAGLERRAAPEGLAAALADDRVPDWLVPVPLGATPFRVYQVR